MPDRQRYRLFFNFSYLGIIQAGNFLLSLLVIPYVISRVGAAGFGIIAVAQVLIFYLSVTADYGFNRTAIRDVALYKDDHQKISRVFSTVIVAKLMICLMAFILLVALVFIVPIFHQNEKVYLFAFSFVLGQALLVNWFFQGLEKMKYNALISLFGRALFVAFVFLFLKNENDAWMYLFFMGLGNMIAGVVSIILAVRIYKLGFVKVTGKDVKNELKEGWPVTVSNLSMTTIQYIGIFILRIFTNDIIVGFYSIAEKIYFAMKLVLDVFSQAAYPRVCRLLFEGRHTLMAFFKRSYVLFLTLVIVFSAAVFIFSPLLIRYFLGHEQADSAFYLRILCAAVVVVCLNIPACLVLLGGDHKKNYLKVFTAGMIINILANLAMAPVWQATGTVLATLFTEVLITAGLYVEVYRIYKKRNEHQ